MPGHRDLRCSYTASRGVHWRGQLNTDDHPEISAKTPIAVVIFSEHVEVNRGDWCLNEGSALAVLYGEYNCLSIVHYVSVLCLYFIIFDDIISLHIKIFNK